MWLTAGIAFAQDGGIRPDVSSFDAPTVDTPASDVRVPDAPTSDVRVPDAPTSDVRVPDVPGPRCGDGSCNGGESCSTCSIDCGVCPVPDAGGPRCGDRVCSAGESCASCAMDCGACRVCGDGICSAPETCSSCEIDCRPCPMPDAGAPDVVARDVSTSDVRPSDASADVTSDAARPDISTVDVIDVPMTDTRPMDVGSDTPSPDVPRVDVPRTDTPGTDVGSDTPTADMPGDVGDAGCNMPPRLRATATASIRWRIEPPEVLGTGASVTAMASFRAMAGVSGTSCNVGFSAMGGGMACGGVLGQRVCVAVSVGGGGSCTMPLVCETPPVPTCDDARSCCTKSAMASATVSRTWTQSTGFGPFTCRVMIGGSVGASLTGENRSGPGCMPCMDQSSITGRVTLGASGGASCSIRVLGYNVSVGARAAACANGGAMGTIGCGAEVAPVGGASFSISVPRVTVGWFTVGPFNRKWEVGSGC